MNAIRNKTETPARSTDSGVELFVSVLPRSSQCAIVGIKDNALKVKLTKPPVDGQANAQCCRLIAKTFGIAKTRVRVVRGDGSRSKVLLLSGISLETVQNVLYAHGL